MAVALPPRSPYSPNVLEMVFCEKTATPSTAEVGEPITFTITERCPFNGPGCINTNPLVDELLSGLTVDSVDPAGCGTSGNTVTCSGGVSSTQPGLLR